jgi:isocitrate dehydrogenase (NAD+)
LNLPPDKLSLRLMSTAVTLIPGDGIGPSVIGAARRVVDATGIDVTWDVQQLGIAAVEQCGEPLPQSAIDSIRSNGLALKGPVSTPIGREGFRSVNVALRRELDLFAQVRLCATHPGSHETATGIDLVVIRDTIEDLYAGVELEVEPVGAAEVVESLARHGRGPIPADAGLSIKYLSRTACERIADFAFDYARRAGRRRVTAVHKASVMRCTDGLFLEAAIAAGARNPDIEFDDRLVDNLCGQLVHRGGGYDVLVMPNMYGDIVSDVAAGLIGGVGLAPGANYGPEVAVFEPAHGSAPRHAGANRANPTAAILSAAMLLEHVGEHDAAVRVGAAVDAAIAEGAVTYDLKRPGDASAPLGTSELAERVIALL